MKTPRYKQAACWIARSAFPLLLILCSQNAGAQTNTFPSSGNVGVGTTTPDTYANVHVYNAPNAGVDIQSSNTSGWSRLRLSTGTRTWGWFAGDASQPDAPNKIGLYDYTAGTFRMMVDSSGNVGIGTSTPGRRFEVLAPDGEAARLYRNANSVGFGVNIKFAFNNSNNARTDFAGVHGLIQSNTAGAEQGVLLFSTASSGTLTEKLRIDSAGNVGVGTTNPGYRLDVQGGRINSSEGLCIAGDCKTAWSQVGGGGGGSQWTTVSPSNIYYSGGSVGVGTNSPAALLDVRNSDGYFLAGFGYGANKETFVRAGSSSAGVVHIGDLNTTKTLLQESGGNVGIGTSTPNSQYKLDVAGNINSSATITGNNIVAKYQDVAEWVPSTEQFPAGTVVVLNSTKSNEVLASTHAYDTRVAGVISAQPGITLGESGPDKVLVATTGRVKVKVDASRGPIQPGDLLVTSDIPGVAMKSQPVNLGGVQLHRPGTLIGKALEPLAKGSGEILVLLSLQ